MSEAKYPVQATETTLRLVEELKANDGGRVTELAASLGLSKSAVHNHLSTLLEHGYAIKEEGVYRLSFKFLEIGGVLRSRSRLFRVAQPEVSRLAEETGELANLMIEENGRGVYLLRSKGDRALDLDTYVGMRKHLHATALGKAILAFLPDERLAAIIGDDELPRFTDRTIVDEAELRRELDDIQDRGIAFDDEEATAGVRCVAAPIRADEEVLGAVSVSAPTSRMQTERFKDAVPERVRRAANVIELNLKFP